MSQWLLDTLLATSGLMLLVLLVREPVRRLFGSRVAYGLWLIPVARLFMPTLTRTVERTIAAPPAFEPIALPLASESLWMARVAPPQESLVDRLGGLPTILVALWLAVAIGLFISRMIAFHRDRRAILGSSFGASRVGRVRIIRSPEVVSPVALGIVKPIVAVPADFERRYAPRERRLVLEHELAHHRSGDLVANLFAFVLLCLQWFNPLAWLAHAAFRFDQEAACDARVLDKSAAGDRADYGRAIAKAASGRALLFASALDRRNTLQRRLQSMLRNSNPTRRIAGRLLVVTGIAAALPLTASRAVDYVDVPAPAISTAPVSMHTTSAVPTRSSLFAAAPRMTVSVVSAAALTAQAQPISATIPVTSIAAAPTAVQPVRASEPEAAALTAAAVAPVETTAWHDSDTNISIHDDLVTIDGVTKRWEDLTPAEMARVRAAVAKARASLAKTHIDQAQLMRDVASIPDQRRIAEIQNNLARAQANIANSIRRIDERAPRDRAAGRSPDQLDAAIRSVLQSAQGRDLQAGWKALANIDRQKIAGEVAGAQGSIEAAKAELARIQARIDADQRQ